MEPSKVETLNKQATFRKKQLIIYSIESNTYKQKQEKHNTAKHKTIMPVPKSTSSPLREPVDESPSGPTPSRADPMK